MKSCYPSDYAPQSVFEKYSPFFHLNTPENYPVIFTSDAEYKDAVNLLALCASVFPQVMIITFQIMSNHVHLVASGKEENLLQMFNLFSKLLKKYIEYLGRSFDIDVFKAKLSYIDTLEYLRNSISYTNRNGFIVCDKYTPDSYPWGANIVYFNDLVKQYLDESSELLTFRKKQSLAHSHIFNKVNWLKIHNGMVIPQCFCRIDIGEAVFRNPRQYFYRISRNIESDKMIASQIGETLYYTDTDLYYAVSSMAKKISGNTNPALLDKGAKVEVAVKLKYDYNASIKQIGRILKMDSSSLESLFQSGATRMPDELNLSDRKQ